ncbi:preprotein translocase subunit SecE [Firmicutes bacterium CAG:884]|jgi:preprotein translocase subunit SecE|nr:preprotein translocase subunit SecE [Bacillota bacterium]CCY94608.1 preprotein translocase subunit SecE [Firmicutes bacterium CAG:884]
MSFLKDVKSEMKKVRFPNKKEMITYSVATISLVIFFALYFGLLDLIIAGIKTLINGY